MDINRLKTNSDYCNHLLSLLVTTANSDENSKVVDQFDDPIPKFLYSISIPDGDLEEYVKTYYIENEKDDKLIGLNKKEKQRIDYLDEQLRSGKWSVFHLTYTYTMLGKTRYGVLTAQLDEENPEYYKFNFYPKVEESDITIFSAVEVDEDDFSDFMEKLEAVVARHFSFDMLINKQDFDNEMSKYVLEHS